jgi:PfaD family protein
VAATVSDPPFGWSVRSTLSPIFPEWLGDRRFTSRHGVRFPYLVGEMANGIATAQMVVAAARTGVIGFFGAAGMMPARIETALAEIEAALEPGLPWGSNLIHSPQEPALEERVADLYLRRGLRVISASAFMGLTRAVVRCAYHGLRRDRDGVIRRTQHVFAKVSRPEVALPFLEPAPHELLEQLAASGQLTGEEVELARNLPVADHITVESDSGGHTDNRPLAALLPTVTRIRDEIAARRRYEDPVLVGAAGGIGTPAAVAGAFALGADYVMTGSVNQACVESGLHPDAREMLARADIADVMMAPAADMFELGVDVQVLRRGTMFGLRARRLYQLYRAHASFEELPADARGWLEQEVLGQSIDSAWKSTRSFWLGRDPVQVERAEANPRHLMALVFRSYLGLASRWAIAGEATRRTDYQIWCGPAMGAFNAWTAGTFLVEPAERTVAQVAANLLEGAAAVTRAQQFRSVGVPVPSRAFDPRPKRLLAGVTAGARPAGPNRDRAVEHSR